MRMRICVYVCRCPEHEGRLGLSKPFSVEHRLCYVTGSWEVNLVYSVVAIIIRE